MGFWDVVKEIGEIAIDEVNKKADEINRDVDKYSRKYENYDDEQLMEVYQRKPNGMEKAVCKKMLIERRREKNEYDE